MTRLKKAIIGIATLVAVAALAVGISYLATSGAGSDKISMKDSVSVADAENIVYSSDYSSLEEAVNDNLSSSSSSQKTLVLDKGYSVNSTITIPAGKYITIDFNKCSLRCNSAAAFLVKGTLTFVDSNDSFKKYSTNTRDIAGTTVLGSVIEGIVDIQTDEDTYQEYLYIAGGMFSNSRSESEYAEGITVAAGGTLNMYAGIITNMQMSNGGGVCLDGTSSSKATFNMYGGAIIGSVASGNGGGVYANYANCNLYGGIIAGNTASKYGGAVYVGGSSTVNMGHSSSVSLGSSIFDTMYIGLNSGRGTIYTADSSSVSLYDNLDVYLNTCTSNTVGMIVNHNSSKPLYVYGGSYLCNTGYYGGFYVGSNTSMIMSGGLVYGNECTYSARGGGAIYADEGSSLTITGGTFSKNKATYGGAILMKPSSTASISGATFTYNESVGNGGCLYFSSSGDVTIKNSTISYNYTPKSGGGIFMEGSPSITLSNVVMDENEAGGTGGAIYNLGNMTITNSTIKKNYAGTYGGGIYTTNTSLALSDVEISENRAGAYGGIYYYSGSLSISGEMIITGNTNEADYNSNLFLRSGMTVTLGGSLSGTSSIGVKFANSSQTQITTEETTTARYKTAAPYFFLDTPESYEEDLFIGFKNGAYIEILPVDDAVAHATDSNGKVIGYYSSLENALTGAASTDPESYGTAVLDGDTNVDSTITVENGTYVALDLYGASVTWTGSSKSNFFLVYGSLDLYDSKAEAGTIGDSATAGVTKISSSNGTQYKTTYGVMGEDGVTTYYYYLSGAITGGQATAGVSGSGTTSRGGAVYVASDAAFNMYGGTLYNNTATYGGAVHTYGTFTMYGGAISENYSINSSTNYNGAAMLIEGDATANLFGGVIYGNVASGKGRGIIDNLGTLLLDKFDGDDEDEEKARYAGYDTDKLGPVISGNTSSGYGGILNRGSLTMNAGYITLNQADYEGGGVNTNGSGFTMTGGYITGNTTSYYGAGVHVVDTFTMTGGYISCNESSKYAGGVNVLSKATFVMTGGEISGNTAKTYGGGICSDGILEISGGTISGNKANGGNGGGIYAGSSATTTISDGTISGNAASETGGGVWSRGVLTISGGTITGNRAESYAGGVEIYSSTFTMTGGTISNNSAPLAGAVSISQKGTTFVMSGGIISGNKSTTGNGGGVYAGLYGTYFTMTGGTITGNESAGVGGGVFCNNNSTVVLSGGGIYGNTAATYGGGVYFTSSASLTIGGEVEIKKNLDASGSYDNLYFLSNTTVTVDETFSGTVYVYSAATVSNGGSVKFSKNTMTADKFLSGVSGKILSDQKYCVGYNSYVYLYSACDFSVIYIYITEDGTVTATHYCSQCFMSGGACEETIRYELRADGTALVYVEEAGCKCYGKDSDGSFTEGGLVLDSGALVASEDGSLAWYEDLATAVAVAKDGDTVILLSDIDGDDVSDGLNLEIGADVTLDLNGHTVDCDVSVSTSSGAGTDTATLTITDSSGGGNGGITGGVTSGDGVTIAKKGGTYSAEDYSDIGGDLAEGYFALYEGTDDENIIYTIIYTVYSEGEIYELAEVYVEITDDEGNKTKLYFSTLEDAIKYAPEGVTITLIKDIDMVSSEESVTLKGQTSITIDLNGYMLVADITIEAGSYDEYAAGGEKFALGASLTVVDMSDGSTGSLAGTITVEGESDDEAVESGSTGANNAFSDTLVIVASAVSGELTVVTDGLDSVNDGVTYTFALTEDVDEDGNAVCVYAITSNHEHVYDIAEAFMDDSGEIKVRLRCSCGEYYTETVIGETAETLYEFEIPADTGCNVTENGDGTVTYTFTSGNDSGKITFTYGEGADTKTSEFDEIVLTITPLVKVEIDGETYYLNENSIDSLSEIINGAEAGSTVVVTLLDDVEIDLSIEGGSVKIDLNGHTLMGEISLSSETSGGSGASLEITDSSASSEEGTESVGEGKVSGVAFTLDSGSTLVLSGGTYDEYVSVTVKTCEGTSDSDIKNYLNPSAASDGSTYCMVDNGNGTFTVTTTDIAKKDAAIIVEIEVGESTQEIYFGSIEAAVAYVNDSGNNVSKATIVLIKDCEVGEDGLDIASSVTIDLAGNTLTADIDVEGNGFLKITDSSAEVEDSDGAGLLVGSISGEGDISVESGSFTEDVGQYVTNVGCGGDEPVEKVLLATSDTEGGVIYTVTNKSSVETSVSSGDIQASVTYTVGDESVTVYYKSIEDAVAALKDGDTLTILTNVASGEAPVEITIADGKNVTIDLGGHTLTADITVEKDSSVVIKDSSADDSSNGTGLLDGNISGDGSISVESGSFTEDVGQYVTSGSDDEGNDEKVLLATSDNGNIIYTVSDKSPVEASIENGDVQAKITYTVENDDGTKTTVTVYYESKDDAIASLKDGDTLTLLAGVEGGLTFTSTDEDGISITLDLNGNNVTGGISVGEGVSLTITDGSSGSAGTVSGDVTVDGADLTIKGGIYDDDITEYVSDGSYIYAATTDNDNGYSFEVTGSNPAENGDVSVVATVTFTGDNGEFVTVYFEDLQDALNYASDISSGVDAREDVVVTLTDDCTAGEDETAPTVSVESGSFTIDMNGCATDINLEISGEASITILNGSEDEGEFKGSITVNGSGSLEISGGTFSTGVSEWTEEGFAVLASSDEDGNLTYTVTEEDAAKSGAKVSVTVSVDGVETTTYYESFEDAMNALYDAMDGADDATKFTITLWDDVDVEKDISGGSDLLTDGALTLEGTFNFDLNGNNFTGDVYAEGASDDGDAADVTIDIDGGTFSGDITVADGAEVDMDLSGGTYEGNVTVGEKDGTGGATFTVTDSSAEYDDDGVMTETGTGLFDGIITDNNSGSDSITVDGGTFTSDVGDYVNSEKYETVIGKDQEGGETFVIVPKTNVDDFSEAYVTVTTTVDGLEVETTTYYESFEDAIKAAAGNGGTVTLTGDASVEMEILSSVTIDLNGHNLSVDIIIDADAGGQLTITDSEGTGELSGAITVVGTDSCTADDDGNAVNPYENVLVMNGGAAPGADLTIDLTSLGAEGEFTYAVTSDEGAEDVTYGIVPVDGHRDVYNIAIWALNEDGTATLRFMCACGNYLCDKNGNVVEYTAEASVTDEGDGVYTFAAVIEIEENNADGAPEGTYEKSWTVAVAATVEADGKTYYMSDLQSAIELVENLGGGVVTLYEDCEEAVEVRGDVEIDLNGHDMEGGITVDTGAYLIVSGDGSVGGLDAEEKASVKLRGGTYEDDIYSYVDGYEGYVAFVNEDGSVTVMQESDAATNARAAVTDADGNTVYYESLEEAVEAMKDGSTLTLWDVIGEDETVEIEGFGGVTIDANGYGIEGTLAITECDDVTVDMDGGDIIGTVTFTDSDNAVLGMGGDGVSSGDIEGQVSFSGCENSSVNMDGGDVKSAGLVSFTNSDGASFDADGGDIAGSVTFDGCEDASVDMDGGTVTSTGSVEFTGSTGASFDAEGGDIDGKVSFTDCEGASVSMGSEDAEGGNINGTVSFDGCDGAEFDLDGGEMNGTVTFTESNKSEIDLGGGAVGESGEVNFNQSDNAVIYLGDGTFSGTMNAAGGSSVEITGSGDATDGTFSKDDTSELELHGGTYDEETLENYYGTGGEDEEGYRKVKNEDGSYTVMTEEEFEKNASASVTYKDDNGNEETVHFATLGEALEYVESLGSAPYILVTLEDDYYGDIDFVTDDCGDVTFDLSGHKVTGDISMAGGGTLTIIDSEGGAYVSGDVGSNDESEIVVEGGTYSSENVSDYVDSNKYVIVVGNVDEDNSTYTVMTEDKAKENFYVYVETYDKETDTPTKQYYETLEDAVVSADGGTIVLTGDLDVSDTAIEITTETVIDTSGHSLTGDFVVVVADGDGADGSLTVQDSSDDGTGSFTGKVTVVDKSEGTSGDEGAGTDYSDAFVLEDGLTPDGVETDFSGLNGDGTYHFEEVTDSEGNTSYGIVSGGSHSYTNPVWSVVYNEKDGSWTITLELVCECGEYLTDEYGDNVVFVLTDATVEETEDGRLHVTGTIEASYTYVNGNGNLVEVTGYYDCDKYFDGVAATVVTDDGTIYFFFDDEQSEVQSGVQSAVDFAETHGGYVTLYEDASNIHINVKTQTVTTTTEYYEPEVDENGDARRDEDGNIIYSDTPTVETIVETVYTDVVIDLNGHNLEIGIQADKGNSVTLTDTAEERGNADVGLSVDGVVIFDDVNITMCENVVEDDADVNGEIWIRGDTTIDLNGMTIFNVNEIEGNLTLTGGDGSVLKLGDDIDLTDGSIIIDGSAGIDLGGNDLTTDILVTEGSSFDLNLNGATFTGDIDLEDDASLTIRDSSVSKTGGMEGTVTAEGGADVEIYDGVYDPRDEDSALILDLGDDTVIQSATDASGETYYETVSSAEHETQGHGYDILTGWTFNAENSTITLYYDCLCGYTSVRNIVISEDDYTTEVAEDGTVTVSCSVSGTVEAPNRSIYEYSVEGTFELDYAISVGESANGYVYAVREFADCYGTGLDTYTYGDGKGIVVKVVTPVTHRGLTDYVGEDGNTYHKCEICGSYVTDINSDAGYAELDDLVEDVGFQNAYDEEKQAALDELETWKDEIISVIDPETPGYDNVIAKIEEIFEELKEEISGMDYEAQTEAPDGAEEGWRSEYADALTEALEEALSDAMVEVEKTANQEVSRNVLQDTYNQLYESGKYSDEALDELKGEFDAAIADLEEITVTSEDDLAALYDEYLQRVLAALYAIKIDVALTTDDSAYVGSVTSSEGLDSGVEVVITDMGTAGYTFTTDAELIYKGSKDYAEDEVADLVEGKGIVAVFDISLVNSTDGTEVYVFSGYYVVRINDLPESVLAYEGLQIVFVGDDGRVEIYDTDVHADEGYLEFTTTHFSEYMILGTGAPLSTGEKETDLTAAIIALAVVAGVLLILGIVLLIVLLMKKGIVGGKSKKTAALGIFALLAVVPAGGIAIVVVLAVLAAAFLAADIYMIYAIFTSVPVVEYVDEGTQDGGEAGNAAVSDEASDVTLGQSVDTENEPKVGDV